MIHNSVFDNAKLFSGCGLPISDIHHRILIEILVETIQQEHQKFLSILLLEILEMGISFTEFLFEFCRIDIFHMLRRR